MSKHEIQGKKGIITGWNDGLSRSGLRMSSVNFLTDEDCQNKVSEITNQLWEIGARALCSSAMPHAFLEDVSDYLENLFVMHIVQFIDFREIVEPL